MLVVIALVATLLSIFSYQYYTSSSAKIADIASHEIRTNAQIQVHDLSRILSNKFEGISNLLQTLADSPTIHNNEYKRASTVINIRQQYSKELTDFYMWLDKNGKMIWLSNMNQSAYEKYKGIDLSYRPYFSVPRSNHDELSKYQLSHFLSQKGLEPIILHDKPNSGNTLIEKFEKGSLDVRYAFVLLTPDDQCDGHFQARQNVILELGYFWGNLGRDRVCCLSKGPVELPSDMYGIALIPFKQSVKEVYYDIETELISAGYKI